VNVPIVPKDFMKKHIWGIIHFEKDVYVKIKSQFPLLGSWIFFIQLPIACYLGSIHSMQVVDTSFLHRTFTYHYLSKLFVQCAQNIHHLVETLCKNET
jgi:hypothetical protein